MQAKIEKPLILIGMMGSGKTTIGKKLAQRLNVDWVDSDRLIEKAEKRSISDIFADEGEAIFRQKERDLIERLLAAAPPPAIIALGGGGFLQPEIRAICAQKAITIWLQADCATLVRRLDGQHNRPLLTGGGGDISTRLAELIHKRAPIYAKADIIVEENTSEKMTENILSCLHQRGLL